VQPEPTRKDGYFDTCTVIFDTFKAKADTCKVNFNAESKVDTWELNV